MQNPPLAKFTILSEVLLKRPSLGKQRGGDDGTKQKYRKVHKKNRELEPGYERAGGKRAASLPQSSQSHV